MLNVRRFSSFCGAAIMTACLLFPVSGYSQINPFPRDIGLTKQDRALMRDAAKKLYTNDSAAVGATESWRNEKSEDSGTVTIIKLFQDKGYSCKALEHNIVVKGHADVKHYRVNWCKVGAEWKTIP